MLGLELLYESVLAVEPIRQLSLLHLQHPQLHLFLPQLAFNLQPKFLQPVNVVASYDYLLVLLDRLLLG